MKAPALALLFAFASTPALSDPADLLHAIRSGDAAALEHAIVADLNAHMGFDRPASDYTVAFDEAVCHEAQRSWEPEEYVIGVCFVPVRAMQVNAQYALIVSYGEPVSFAMLDYAIE